MEKPYEPWEPWQRVQDPNEPGFFQRHWNYLSQPWREGTPAGYTPPMLPFSFSERGTHEEALKAVGEEPAPMSAMSAMWPDPLSPLLRYIGTRTGVRAGAPGVAHDLGSAVTKAGNAARYAAGTPESKKYTVGDLTYGPHETNAATAFMASGSLVPKPMGSAGIFGGRLAQTADHAALAKAEQMAAENVAPEAIWKETGWFRGADGKWRFEISDKASKLKGPITNEYAHKVAAPMKEQLDHPELYEAYPQLGDIHTILSKDKFEPLGGFYGKWKPYLGLGSERPLIGFNALTGQDLRSGVLHELQHGVQGPEGHAIGGHGSDYGYAHVAGEVEARNTQIRQDLSADSRRRIPPWKTQIIPNEQQLFRFNPGDHLIPYSMLHPDPSAEIRWDLFSQAPKSGVVGALPAAATSRRLTEGFYSHLTEVAENAPMKAGNAQQWLNYFKKQGVKDAELKWSGMADWLKQHGDYMAKVGHPKIPADVVRKYARDNEVMPETNRYKDNEYDTSESAIEEAARRAYETEYEYLSNDSDSYYKVDRDPDWAPEELAAVDPDPRQLSFEGRGQIGQGPTPPPPLYRAEPSGGGRWHIRDRDGNIIEQDFLTETQAHTAINDLMKQVEHDERPYVIKRDGEVDPDDPRYDSERAAEQVLDEWIQEDARMRVDEMSQDELLEHFGEKTSRTLPYMGRRPGGGSDYSEVVLSTPYDVLQKGGSKGFGDTHIDWPEENIPGWVLAEDYTDAITGGKVKHGHEFQGDWAQAAADDGINDPARVAAAKQAFEAAIEANDAASKVRPIVFDDAVGTKTYDPTLLENPDYIREVLRERASDMRNYNFSKARREGEQNTYARAKYTAEMTEALERAGKRQAELRKILDPLPVMDPEQAAALENAWNQAQLRYREAEMAYRKTDDAIEPGPWVTGEVPDLYNLLFKRMFSDAAHGNYDYLSWSSPAMVKARWGDKKFFDDYYGQIAPNVAKKLAREHDPNADITQVALSSKQGQGIGDPTKTASAIKITPEMRESIKTKGFRTFVNPKEAAPLGMLPAAATSRSELFKPNINTKPFPKPGRLEELVDEFSAPREGMKSGLDYGTYFNEQPTTVGIPHDWPAPTRMPAREVANQPIKNLKHPATRDRLNKQALPNLYEGPSGLVNPWYDPAPLLDKFNKVMGERQGSDQLGKYLDFVAATSPLTEVGQNIIESSKAWNLWNQGKKFTKNSLGLDLSGPARGVKQKLATDVAADIPFDPRTAPKVANFRANLRGAGTKEPSYSPEGKRLTTPVTLDSVMARTWPYRTKAGDPALFKQSAYGAGVNAAHDLAEQLGGVPGADWQAAVWQGHQKGQHADTSYGARYNDSFARQLDSAVQRTARETGTDPNSVWEKFILGELPTFYSNPKESLPAAAALAGERDLASPYKPAPELPAAATRRSSHDEFVRLGKAHEDARAALEKAKDDMTVLGKELRTKDRAGYLSDWGLVNQAANKGDERANAVYLAYNDAQIAKRNAEDALESAFPHGEIPEAKPKPPPFELPEGGYAARIYRGSRTAGNRWRPDAPAEGLKPRAEVFWGSDHPDVASHYTGAKDLLVGGWGSEESTNLPAIIPADVFFRRPFIHDAKGGQWDNLRIPAKELPGGGGMVDDYGGHISFTTDDLVKEIRDHGLHDGVVVKNVRDDGPPATTVTAIEEGTVFSPLTGEKIYSNPEDMPVGALPAAATSRRELHGPSAGIPTEAGRPAGAGSQAGAVPERGGLQGREGQLGASSRARDPYAAIPGIPSQVRIPGVGDIPSRPVPWLVDAANSYMRRRGTEHQLPEAFGKIDPQRGARIAQAYEAMPHAPSDPKVRRSYDALAQETLDQFRALKDQGFEPRFNKAGEDPYVASPALGYPEMRDMRSLSVFPTVEGYGDFAPSFTTSEIANNPMLKGSGEKFRGEPATINDLFRGVHDAFGHYAYGNPFFRAPGEERAWMLHSGMYSPEARGAMTTELRGQNNWLNFGPHGEANRTASAADTIYAPQKVGLLPDWVMEEGRLGLTLEEAIELGLVDRALRLAREGKAEGGAVAE